jgi:hypothetical protein
VPFACDEGEIHQFWALFFGSAAMVDFTGLGWMVRG